MQLEFAIFSRYIAVFSGAFFFTLSLCACQAVPNKNGSSGEKPRWFNSEIFENIDSMGESPYDLEFDVTFYRSDNTALYLKSCLDVLATGDNVIAEREFARWQLLKADCEAASRFYSAPKTAVSYWENTFNFELLKTFPATAVPYFGGQGLDGRSGKLGNQEPRLTKIESGKNNVKVSIDDMVVNYVVVARADFNRDGYQDVFVRLDWYIESSFGDGFDWLVLTLTSPTATPMMLWRK